MMASLEVTLELAEQWAKRRFAGQRDAREKVADTVSVAWELVARYGDRAYSQRLAKLAVKRVLSGRQFPSSLKSLDVPRGERQRADFDVNEVGSVRGNPARLACFRIDFESWFATLSEFKRELAKVLASGESTANTAVRFQLTAGRISQLRRELEDSYREFLSE
jgi:hypothetical protein